MIRVPKSKIFFDGKKQKNVKLQISLLGIIKKFDLKEIVLNFSNKEQIKVYKEFLKRFNGIIIVQECISHELWVLKLTKDEINSIDILNFKTNKIKYRGTKYIYKHLEARLTQEFLTTVLYEKIWKKKLNQDLDINRVYNSLFKKRRGDHNLFIWFEKWNYSIDEVFMEWLVYLRDNKDPEALNTYFDKRFTIEEKIMKEYEISLKEDKLLKKDIKKVFSKSKKSNIKLSKDEIKKISECNIKDYENIVEKLRLAEIEWAKIYK